MKYLKKAMEKREKLEDAFVSKLLHPQETPVECHTREQKEKEFFGTGLEKLVTLYVPGVYFYKGLKEAKQKGWFEPAVPLRKKIAVCSIVLASELVIDSAKVGMGYALYEFAKALYQ